MAVIDDYFRHLIATGGSDLHLSEGQPPKMRTHGAISAISDGILEHETIDYMLREICEEKAYERYLQRGDLDFAYEMDAQSRFRCNYFKQNNGLGAVFRLIPTKIKTIDDLGVPKTIESFGDLRSGLVLVTGPTGSGKSTTLAALIDYINRTYARHIITVEEPIEFVHNNKKSTISQREVPIHCPSFADGLRASLREDADIVLVGEMRDLETISLAITAAETGHLVLATLHTGSAARTLDRILDVFPTEQREQIRIMVGESLRGIISQQLVPRADGTGRELALELLVNTPAVSAIIRDGKTFMLPGVMQTGKNVGMIMMDDALAKLYRDGIITQEEALGRAVDRGTLKANLGV